MQKSTLYPKLKAEILFNDAEKMQVLLFRKSDNTGFIIDGIASEFSVSLDGSSELSKILEQFHQKYFDEHPEIKKILEEFISTLEQEELVEFLNTHINP